VSSLAEPATLLKKIIFADGPMDDMSSIKPLAKVNEPAPGSAEGSGRNRGLFVADGADAGGLDDTRRVTHRRDRDRTTSRVKNLNDDLHMIRREDISNALRPLDRNNGPIAAQMLLKPQFRDLVRPKSPRVDVDQDPAVREVMFIDQCERRTRDLRGIKPKLLCHPFDKDRLPRSKITFKGDDAAAAKASGNSGGDTLRLLLTLSLNRC
jgi:hypothetical protein